MYFQAPVLLNRGLLFPLFLSSARAFLPGFGRSTGAPPPGQDLNVIKKELPTT